MTTPAHASITSMEDSIGKVETKAEFSTSERLLIAHLVKKLESLDVDFKLHHHTILDLLNEEEEGTLKQEYAIFNDYGDKVTHLHLIFNSYS